MGKMTENTFATLFEYGKKVYLGTISINEAAKQVVVTNPEIAESSAKHYISWYSKMRSGEYLTWQTNSYFLQYLAKRIYMEEGKNKGEQAFQAAILFARHFNNTKLEEDLNSMLVAMGTESDDEKNTAQEESFRIWLKTNTERPYSDRTASRYVYAINSIEKWLSITLPNRVFSTTDQDSFDRLYQQIVSTPKFKDINRAHGNGDMSAALSLYKRFLADNSPMDNDWWPTKSEYDPGISKERWAELLNTPKLFTQNSLIALAAFYDIGGAATCAMLEAKYGKSSDFYRTTCMQQASKLVDGGYCVAPNLDKNSKLWPILFVGKDADAATPGNYIWKLRDELKDALEEFGILRFLVNDRVGNQFGTFDSWEILDENTAIKHCDKSFFEHNGSGVPKGICWFFNADHLGQGEMVRLYFHYEGREYTGRISNESTDRRRVRIFWNTDLGKEFRMHMTDNAAVEFTKESVGRYNVRFLNNDNEERNTWLLSWNPAHWNWEDYCSAISSTHEQRNYDSIWSCANTHVSVGDRVFLMVLGQGKANGIIASGFATSGSFESDHWDAEKREQGIKARRINVSFDWIVDYINGTPLYQTQLMEAFPEQQWSPQGSGIAIKRCYAEPLETMWQRLKDDQKEAGEEEVPEINTQDALAGIKEYIFAKGFDYPDGLIENFYLSLKSKPFVILAGTSGTGKTRLVRLFAEAIGAEYKLVSVRPDWSDGSDLFGHTDLSGNFISGPVCDAFEAAMENRNKPVFLCLDEMNLARVEYYLSDFLSVIESRDWQNGHVVTEPIAQYAHGVPENLYIIGTVNMDETTFPFSKKVLDRANTIEFSHVDLMPKQRNGEQVQAQSLPNNFLKTEYLTLATDCTGEEELVEKICTELQAMNQLLVKANAHVGYRVRDEIVFYLLNNRDAGDLLAYEKAMDNEIMQKILPRIQGSSTAIKTLLIDLFKFCMGSGSGIDAESGNVGAHMTAAAASARYPASAEKIGYMMTRFEDDGFTSYWL